MIDNQDLRMKRMLINFYISNRLKAYNYNNIA
jgi:hypothetical protein